MESVGCRSVGKGCGARSIKYVRHLFVKPLSALPLGDTSSLETKTTKTKSSSTTTYGVHIKPKGKGPGHQTESTSPTNHQFRYFKLPVIPRRGRKRHEGFQDGDSQGPACCRPSCQ